MRLDHPHSPHLTYCSSIHPGETWPEVRRNLSTYATAVKAALAPDRPFGLGLRLSAQAAASLSDPSALDEFRDFLRQHNFYVFTLNGFPYGEFGSGRVKERVYLPDWRDDARLAYSDQLATLLAALLPMNLEGSISTVPCAFRAHVNRDTDLDRMAGQLVRHAATLFRISVTAGKIISLALEPEPACCLETSVEAVEFFQCRLFGRAGLDHFSRLTGLDRQAGESALRRHLGVCLDACHAAIEFEQAPQTVQAFLSAGIRISKVQISAGLRVTADHRHPDIRQALTRFDDGVYLHQVVMQQPTGLRRHVDLPDALQASPSAGGTSEEWRIHCHVPIFQEHLGPFAGTQEYLRELFAVYRQMPFTSHFEVETYTWHVLPEEYRGEDVVQSISRELQWAQAQLQAGS